MGHEDQEIELIEADSVKPTSVRRRIDIEAVLSKTPESWKARYRKVLDGTATRAVCMRVKCAECMGFEDVANRVENCASERCPLWAFRPFQKRQRQTQ